MKVGAGGLQSMVTQEAMRALDTSRLKPPAEETLLQGEDLAMRRMRYELNKAVEQMRKAAELYNQPLEFLVKKGDKPKIQARDRRTGFEREFTLEEAGTWLKELKEKEGRNLNGYV